VGEVTPVTQACVEWPQHGRRRTSPRRPLARRSGAPVRWIGATWQAHLPRTSRGSSRRRNATTGGHSSASACAPDTGTARTAARQRGRARRRSRARPGVREEKQFVDSVFKIDFLHFLKLKCTLHKIANM
jgi:hypothetical protein